MVTIPPPVCHLVEPLTAAEKNILSLLAQGLSDKEIGIELNITPITVRGDHKQNIYDKLCLQPGFRSRKWAVYCARQLGLLPRVDREEDHIPPGDNPYKGLDPFQPEDAHVFFGRETLIEQLLTHLGQNGDAPRFLALVGPSGSGKSSVLRAGLIPALKQDRIPGASTWKVAMMCPRANPFIELEAALRAVAVRPCPDLLELLQLDSDSLVRVAPLILPESQPLLLAIDQFEELFTSVESSTLARRFMDMICATVTDAQYTNRVIITLRADFLDRALLYPDFSQLLQSHTVMMVPLVPDELDRVIALPAQQAHVTLEPGLVARLVAESHEQPGALPLLEFALTELYDSRIGHTIAMSTYDEIGGVRQALAAQADRVFAGLNNQQQEAIRQLFLRLITPGEGTEDVRRHVPVRELASLDMLAGTMDYVVNFLAANRLLTLDLDPTTREPLVEVAHEALIREWGKLRGWLDESRSDVRMERLLAVAVDDWYQHDRAEDYLMQGAKLAQFDGWRATTDLVLTAAEHEFLAASIAARERLQRRKRKMRNLALIISIAVAIGMAGLAFVADYQRRRVEDEKSRAESAEHNALVQASIGLAAQAVAELDSEAPERGVLLALEALDQYPYTSQAEQALAQAVYGFHQYTTLLSDWAAMYGGMFSSSGARVVTVGEIIVVWNAKSGAVEKRLGQYAQGEYGEEQLRGVDWSADERFMVTSSISANTATVCDMETGGTLVIYNGHEGGVYSVQLSSDDRLVLTASADGTAHIWQRDDGLTVQIFRGHAGAVIDAVWSPDDSRIATASADGTIRLWNVNSGAELKTIRVGPPGVLAVAWSPDGSWIASAGQDGLGRVWNVETGDAELVLIGHDDWINDIEWSPDGHYLASASRDGTARVWETMQGTEVMVFGAGDIDVHSVAWSPDGQRLLSVNELVPRVWEVSSPIVRLYGHRADAEGVIQTHAGRWSYDSSAVVTLGATDNTARVWNPLTGEESARYEQEVGVPLFGSLHPSHNEVLVTEPLRIWDLETGEIRLFSEDSLSDAFPVWSPNGRYLYVMSFGGTEYRVYDVGTSTPILRASLEECGFALPGSWSPDSRYIAHPCYSDEPKPLIITDAMTGEIVRRFHGHSAGVQAAYWSPDGTRLLSASPDHTVRVWDFESGETLTVFTGHADWVFDARWSPDGTRIVSGDITGSVRIWAANTGQEVTSFKVGGRVIALDWSPDGTRVLVTGQFSAPEIRPVWQTTGDLIAYANACCVSRELTPDERQQFGLPREES